MGAEHSGAGSGVRGASAGVQEDTAGGRTGAAASVQPGAAAAQALVAAPAAGEAQEPEDFPVGPVIERLPVEVDIVVPVRPFRVRNVLALEPGQVIVSQWGQGNDVPLTAGEVQLAWTEFEVIDEHLAVRVTRLP